MQCNKQSQQHNAQNHCFEAYTFCKKSTEKLQWKLSASIVCWMRSIGFANLLDLGRKNQCCHRHRHHHPNWKLLNRATLCSKPSIIACSKQPSQTFLLLPDAGAEMPMLWVFHANNQPSEMKLSAALLAVVPRNSRLNSCWLLRYVSSKHIAKQPANRQDHSQAMWRC